MVPRRVTFNADANIFYSQIKESVIETQSMKNVVGLDSALLGEASINGKGLDAESTATAFFERAMINKGAKQDSSNFTDREPLKYEFTTNGRRRRGAINNILTTPVLTNNESVITEQQNTMGRSRVLHGMKKNTQSIDVRNSAEVGNIIEEHSTRGIPIEELHVSIKEKDAPMVSLLDLKEKKVITEHSEAEESRSNNRGEIVNLQSQVELLASELVRTQQQIKKQQEEYFRSDAVEVTGEMKDNQELITDVKDLVAKISNDVLMPSHKLQGSVSKTMLKLEGLAEQLNEKVLHQIDKEREQYNEELSFQKFEKLRLVEEMGALRQELQRGKNEWAIERDKLVTEMELSLKHKEDMERKYRWEQQRLDKAREELAKDVMLLENRVHSSREELANADSMNHDLKLAKESLGQEAMRVESLAQDLHSYSSIVSKRDEEVNYLFQLANEAHEYTSSVRAKLDIDILQVKKAVEYVQRERYILAQDRLKLLQQRCAMKTTESVKTRDKQFKSNNNECFVNNDSLLECCAIKGQALQRCDVFSVNALSNIKTRASALHGKQSETAR